MKNESGITLITLVITIVVMIILTFTISVNIQPYLEQRAKSNFETDMQRLKEEVDEFLDDLTVDYERAYKQSTELKSRVDELESSLLHYKKIEDTLQNTLVMAQSTAEEVKNVARQQAEQIIKEAEGNARKSVDDLGQEILMKKKELEDIKKQFDVYKAKMESLLISQLELLKEVNKD